MNKEWEIDKLLFWGEFLYCSELPPHPNVVQVYGVSQDGPQPVLVMEYCGGGNTSHCSIWK
jgi:serine/threonine protein kinase